MVKIDLKSKYDEIKPLVNEFVLLYNTVKKYGPKTFQRDPESSDGARSNLEALDQMMKQYLKLPKPDKKNPLYKEFLKTQKTFEGCNKAYQKNKDRLYSYMPLPKEKTEAPEKAEKAQGFRAQAF